MGRDARTLGAFSLVASLLAAGCSGNKLSDTPAPDSSSTPGLAAFTGTWDGYAEAYSFPSGSDRVRLTIDAQGVGTLRVGDESLLAPPTDPNVGYPPGDPQPDPNALRETFLYPLHAVDVQSARLQAGIDTYDFFASWCALETPVEWTNGVDGGPTSPPLYGCLPNLNGTLGASCVFTEPDGTSLTVDCGKAHLCEAGGVCTCTATSCTSRQPPSDLTASQYSDEIDGALDSSGQTLTGTLSIQGTRVTVHLQKQ